MLDRIRLRFLAFKYAGNKKRFHYINHLLLLYDLIMHSSSDFILRIAPLRKKDHSIRYHPPPSYGLPAGKQFISMDSNTHEFSQYGLFLFPGKILRESFIPFIVISTIILLPLPYLIKNSFCFGGSIIWLISFIWLIGLAGLFTLAHLTMRWVYYLIPPLFSQVWQLWPESQYKLFTTVPHRVKLAIKDRKITPSSAEKYWNPDNNTPMLHQSSEYAKRSNTVQEVLMHLAIFEFFFKNHEYGNNPSQKDGKDKESQGLDSFLGVMESLKVTRWFVYYLAPVWITYFMIIIAMFLYPTFFNKDDFTSFLVIARFPNNLVLAGFLWLIFSYSFIVRRIQYLQNLHKDIKEGLYNSHLELVPQKIISSITQIPHEKHIFSSIQYMQKALYVLQIFAFANLMMMLEVFSQSYG